MGERIQMKKGGGKKKGSAFEREQAKILSLWISNNKDKDLLWRSTLSGGRASSGKVKGTQYGDLCLGKHDGKYVNEAKRFLNMLSVELKSYNQIDLMSALLNDNNNVWKWWEQCLQEANANDVRPLMIIKRNHDKPLMCFQWLCFLEDMFEEAGLIYMGIRRFDEQQILIVRQDDFLGLVKWKKFKEYYRYN